MTGGDTSGKVGRPRRAAQKRVVHPNPLLADENFKRSVSLYLGPYGNRMIGTAKNASARVEAMARRFEFIREQTLPDAFSISEWAVLMVALKEGRALIEFSSYVAVLDLAAEYGVAQISDAYGADPLHLADKLLKLGGVMQIMVCDMAERYWALETIDSHENRLVALHLTSRENAISWRKSRSRNRKRSSGQDSQIDRANEKTLA
jgi:hypothetical protein